MTNVSVPFGKASIEVQIPAGLTVETLCGTPATPLADPVAEAEHVIRKPLETPLLREMAGSGSRVVIAVTDATRECPDSLLVPPMLDEVSAAGVRDCDITILVAVGTHRPSTQREKVEKLGSSIVDRFRVVDHDPFDPEKLAGTGVLLGDREVRLNRMITESDLVISTGRVEPHQYAGFSGGGKTVAIGCAAEDVIQYSHGPAMLDLPGTRLGMLDGNPFQEAVRSVARAARVAFVANCVLDDEGAVVAISYGDPFAVQDSLSQIAARMYLAPLSQQADIAIAGVGYPKDQNMYQASRAASYLQFGPMPAVRKGGVVIVPAACPEGPGEGIGEQRFAAAMAEPGGHAVMLDRLRNGACLPGEQRAYVMGQLMQDVTVILAGVEHPAQARSMGFETAKSVQEALDNAVSRLGNQARLLVVPHALLTIPISA